MGGKAPMLCHALLVLLLRHGFALTDEEKSDLVLQQSIEAASIVRVVGDFNNNATCKWPDCAPVCEACDTKAMGSCMVPGVNECPWNAKCTLGTCFCSKGYCGQGSMCKFRTCALGGQPEPYVAGNLVHQFASLGGELPPFNAQEDDWMGYVDDCKKIPLIVLAFGVVLAIMTCTCILCQLECEFSWIPTSPVVLLVLCAATVAVIAFGVTSRGIVVTENMNMMEYQFRRVDEQIDSAVGLAIELEDMEETFEAIVNDLPQSCSSMVPGAKEAMAMASDKAQEKLLEMKQKVMAFLKVANTAKSMMTRLLQSFDLLKALIVVVPMVPLILMGLWILTIGIATVISWQSSNPHVAERADDLVIRFGAGGACCAMLVASFVSAAYLFAGIVTGGLCMHLDTNVISLVTVVNFTDVSQFKFDIDPILEGAAKYYVLGSQENPMISMIEDVERDAVALYGVYENATWATTPAEMVCSGIKKLNASDALTACSKSVQFARELMSAKNMYPYYQTFAHELMCDKMLHGMKLLILYTIIVSMILMPLVALCADVDLRKWERYKMDNYEDHYDMSYEAQEASPFLKNSLNMMQGMQHAMPGMQHAGMQSSPSQMMQGMQAAAQSRQMQLYSYSGNGN
ncbi:unnamed protein product [Durusdinium trenchii]|uniref:Holocytochrome-c synthase n=2 Tax=Durusdinium trenchii TaxID=1381693 RepID=A0ABP0REG1_9DINO